MEKGLSRDSRELGDSRDSGEPPHCGKPSRTRQFSTDSRDSRDFRDSRDSSSEKTPFEMTPFYRSRQLEILSKTLKCPLLNYRLSTCYHEGKEHIDIKITPRKSLS